MSETRAQRLTPYQRQSQANLAAGLTTKGAPRQGHRINPANPIYSQQCRETQTLRCCGQLYRRWRFAGQQFSGAFSTRCQHCNSLLNWPPNYRPVDRKKAMRELQRDRAVNFLLAGLTTAGQPRQRRAPYVHAIDTGRDRKTAESRRRQSIRESGLASYHRRAVRFADQGLTSRGTPRKYAPRGQRTELEMKWQQFRSEI